MTLITLPAAIRTSGMTLPTALAAPVEAGMMFADAQRPARLFSPERDMSCFQVTRGGIFEGSWERNWATEISGPHKINVKNTPITRWCNHHASYVRKRDDVKSTHEIIHDPHDAEKLTVKTNQSSAGHIMPAVRNNMDDIKSTHEFIP